MDEIPDEFPLDFPVWLVVSEAGLERKEDDRVSFDTSKVQIARAILPECGNEPTLMFFRDELSAQLCSEQYPGMVPIAFGREDFVKCLRDMQAVGSARVCFDPGATRAFCIEISELLKMLGDEEK